MYVIFGPKLSWSEVKIELASCLFDKDALTSSEKLHNKILCSFFRKQKKRNTQKLPDI